MEITDSIKASTENKITKLHECMKIKVKGWRKTAKAKIFDKFIRNDEFERVLRRYRELEWD